MTGESDDHSTDDSIPESITNLRQSYHEQREKAIEEGDDVGAAHLSGLISGLIHAEEAIDDAAEPASDETPVTLNMMEWLIDAHPDYRVTSHRSDAGVEYRLFQRPIDSDGYEDGASGAFVQWVSRLTDHLEAKHRDEWPGYPCPECGNMVWLDGFDDATTVAGEDEYREVRHCGVCEFVVIRRNGGKGDG